MDDKVKEAVLELERAISSLSALVGGREIRDSGLCDRIIARLNGAGGPGLLYLVGYDGPCCDASIDGYHAPWCGR